MAGTTKTSAKLQIGIASAAILLSLGALVFKLANIDQLITSKIAQGLLGAIVGFLVSNVAYWIARKKERQKKSIFLSYSIQDKDIAKTIEQDLTNDGFEVFNISSMTHVGDSISSKIEQAMSRANFLVLLISKDTQQSRWINKELDYAKKHNIRILPLVTTELAEVPASIADLRYISVKDSYEAGYNQLKEALSLTRVN